MRFVVDEADTSFISKNRFW